MFQKEQQQSIVHVKPHWKNNLSKGEKAEINKIKNDDSVRDLGTDKNLGPALLQTDWIKSETLNHLNDSNSYCVITQKEWMQCRYKVIEHREQLMSIFDHLIDDKSVKYLRSFDECSKSLEPANFYIIPKIYKTPMASRPIEALLNYITRPISVFIDEFVKPVITMTTVLRDSGELVQIFESTEFPRECYLVTADVSALYPNVDTKKALIAIDLLLKEAKSQFTPLLVQLARLVFENNFLKTKFTENIFQQVFGTAMGTPFSVTAANAFLYYHEKDLIFLYRDNIALYKRFIDDIILLWTGPHAMLLEFLNAFNTKDPRIKITYKISDNAVSFLDLYIYKDLSSSLLQFSTYQKPLYKYLYIPFESFHPASSKKAFIKGKLVRYVRNSSTMQSFVVIRDLFWKRLRLRGYPFKFLFPLFRSIKYSNRCQWLKKSTVKRASRPVIFRTTYNCSHTRIKKVLENYLPDLKCIVAYKSTVTLAQLCK